MNAQTSFQLAALVAGLFAFLVSVLYNLTATNRPDKDRYLMIGATAGTFILSVLLFFLSLIIKP